MIKSNAFDYINVLDKAADAAWLRNDAIANNLANISTPGYKREDITFEKGKTYLIEADSGQGKSTFCSYLLGYRHDYSGKIMFDDKDISQYKTADWTQIRRRNFSMLFQELRLFPELTALENVEIKNNLTRWKNREQIEQMFHRLGISDKLNSLVGKMSFGQQQRVALIRALVQPFDFLIADEPISHLDDSNANSMGTLMAEEATAQGAAIIITSIGKHIDMEYDGRVRV